MTASKDWTARIWDAASGQPIGHPLQHNGEVNTAVFNPNGRHIVTASKDGTARIWEALTGQPIGQPLQHHNPVHSAICSADGRLVVTAAEDYTARIWDALTGKPLAEPLYHDCIVNSAAFSTDGHGIVTALDDNTARIWWIVAPVAAPAWLPDFAEAFVERRCNDETGAIVGFSAPAETLQGLLPRVAQPAKTSRTPPAGASDENFYAEAVQWLLTPVTGERHISPWSSMTLQQFVIERVSKGSPDEAFTALPYHPLTLLTRAELLQLLDGKETGGAAWLRSYVLSLPASESSAEGWRKCAELLAADNYPDLANQILQKAQIAGR